MNRSLLMRLTGRPRRRTLRGRVSLLAVAVIAGWLIVLTVLFNVLFTHRLDGQSDATLRTRARAALGDVTFAKGGRITVDDAVSDVQLDSRIWIYAGHDAVARASGRPELQSEADSLAGRGAGYTDALDDDRFYTLPIVHDGHRVGTVVAALNIDSYQDAEHTALFGSIVVSLLILCGAYPVLRFATARALRPVDKMARQAAEWSTSTTPERFGTGQQFSELEVLTTSLDRLLDRLSAVLRHERQLSTELSHELRTPLTHMAAELDLLTAHESSAQESRAAHQRLQDRVRAMDRIIDTLLTAARAENADAPTGSCNPSIVLASVGASLDPALRFELQPSDVSVGVDGRMLERIITPIVENAARYATSRIAAHADRSGSNVAIDISNDGPALDGLLAERVFDPGFRANESDSHPGVGLGLALSRRLARSADGDVQVVVGGSEATFRVLLPAG